MISQTIQLPSEDFAILMEVVNKNHWKVEKSKSQPQTEHIQKLADNFVITDELIAVMDKSAQTPLHLCISEEELFRQMDAI
jgi:hypothetical protein